MIWLFILGALPITIAAVMGAVIAHVERRERDELHALPQHTEERTVQAR